MILGRLIDRLRPGRRYVTMDAADNSVTFSEKLFEHIKNNADGGEPKVFVFSVPSRETFGFMLNPDIGEPTVLCNIQYNEKYRCIGFETLCPTVGLMLNAWGMAPEGKVRLSVSVRKTAAGRVYYEFDRPRHGKRNG